MLTLGRDGKVYIVLYCEDTWNWTVYPCPDEIVYTSDCVYCQES